MSVYFWVHVYVTLTFTSVWIKDKSTKTSLREFRTTLHRPKFMSTCSTQSTLIWINIYVDMFFRSCLRILVVQVYVSNKKNADMDYDSCLCVFEFMPTWFFCSCLSIFQKVCRRTFQFNSVWILDKSTYTSLRVLRIRRRTLGVYACGDSGQVYVFKSTCSSLRNHRFFRPVWWWVYKSMRVVERLGVTEFSYIRNIGGFSNFRRRRRKIIKK